MGSSRRVLSWLMLLSLLTGISAIGYPAIAGGAVELAYDDGECDDHWTKKMAGYGWYDAVLFSPSFQASQVVAVKYYIESEPAPFNLLILNSSRGRVFTKSVEAVDVGWFEVNLSNDNVVVKGEFYVAMEWTQASAPFLGVDKTNPDGRSYFVDFGIWKTYKEIDKESDGDFMIRATVAPVVTTTTTSAQKHTTAVKGTTAKTTTGTEAGMVLGDAIYFAAGFGVVVAVGIVVLLMVRKRGAASRSAHVTTPSAAGLHKPPLGAGEEFCIRCGSSMPLSASVCPKCGRKQT